MTNKEYLQKELPLWLFNRLVFNRYGVKEFDTHSNAVQSIGWHETEKKVKGIYFSRYCDDKLVLLRDIKALWSENQNFLFPCSVEEALSILEIVEPEFHAFVVKRRTEQNHKADPEPITEWFGPGGTNCFTSCSLSWRSTVEGVFYWSTKGDFSLSSEYKAEQTGVAKEVAKPEPKTIGEWLDLPENALIKEIAEFDHRIHDRQYALVEKLTKDLSDLFHTLPTGTTLVYSKCRSGQSFQPYIDWYERHPKNPKNVSPVDALKDVDEAHSIEWWRDELAKTEPEVAQHLYAQYVEQARTSQTPRKLFGDDSTSFLGGFGWARTEFGHDVHSECDRLKSFQPLKEALATKEPAVKISVVADSTSSQMPGATFPCTIQERLDWMLTQPSLEPIARFIISDGTYRGSREVHGEFRNMQGDSFAYWATGKNVIEQDCNRACSWEPFFRMYPHLRVNTVKPVELKKVNEHRQLLVECANIKEVKLLLKHINQESAFTHSARLVVFYDLDEKKAYHVGNTKKSQWKQIPNKVHKKVSLADFLCEVPAVKIITTSFPKERTLSQVSYEIKVLHQEAKPKKSSWFDDVPVETKINTKSWFD